MLISIQTPQAPRPVSVHLVRKNVLKVPVTATFESLKFNSSSSPQVRVLREMGRNSTGEVSKQRPKLRFPNDAKHVSMKIYKNLRLRYRRREDSSEKLCNKRYRVSISKIRCNDGATRLHLMTVVTILNNKSLHKTRICTAGRALRGCKTTIQVQ